MNKKGQIPTILLMAIILAIFVSGSTVIFTLIDTNYKQGQIDCLEGKIKYHQVLTNAWIEKGE